MPSKLSRIIRSYYASTKAKVRASGGDSLHFEVRYAVRQGFTLSPTLFNYIIDWVLGQALQGYAAVQDGTKVHVSDLAYADHIMLLSNSYTETLCLFEALHHHTAAVRMRIKASKTKVMSAIIPGEQRRAVLLDNEPLEGADKLIYLGSIFTANGLGTEEIRSRINLARSALSRLQSCLWSRREISLRAKGRVYQAVVRSILYFSFET